MRGARAARTLGPIAALACAACGGAASDSVNQSDLTICPGGGVLEGLDVSRYEGAVDWTAVKSAGKAFTIARVSDGLNYPDAYFDSNWAAIKAQGMVRGAYQYFEPGEDPIAQADMVLEHMGTVGAGDLAPIIDVETMAGQSASAVLAAVEQWLAHVRNATGRRPILYTDPSFWNGLGDPSVDADLWIANWSVSCPSVPGAWSGWKFWQYTASGAVAGISGSGVDLDRFNGSLSDLLAYAGGGTQPPAPPSTSVTAPADGASVSGTVTVSAQASAGATRIEIYLDGALIASGTSSPFSSSWDTSRSADGNHQLASKAYDAAGGAGSSAIVTVTVSNSAPPPACPPGTTDVGGTCVPNNNGASALAETLSSPRQRFACAGQRLSQGCSESAAAESSTPHTWQRP